MDINVFPQDERQILERINALMMDWKREVAPSKIVSRGDGETRIREIVIFSRTDFYRTTRTRSTRYFL